MSEPLAYFITFRTYGTWPPGDMRGYVNRDHKVPGSPFAEPDPSVERRAHRAARAAPLVLDDRARAAVRSAILETCAYRGWEVLALNVRTNHVHVVVAAGHRPERVMSDLKSWATRRLIHSGVARPRRPVWSRHGSTRWLWNGGDVELACGYVIEAQ